MVNSKTSLQIIRPVLSEGYPTCHRSDYKVYPAIIIKMCTRKSLEPAERVFGTKIGKSKSRKIICSPKDFPPDGKGAWRIRVVGGHAIHIMNRLKPLIPHWFQTEWEKTRKRCKEEYGVKL